MTTPEAAPPPAAGPAPSPFTLEVHFTGLCLHVRHRTRDEVAVLMPNARSGFSPTEHLDKTPAVTHAGYLRVDLAHVRPDLGLSGEERPTRDARVVDGPFFEVVYRFGSQAREDGGGQTLTFDLPEPDAAIEVDAGLPNLDDIVPKLRVRDDLFTAAAGAKPALAPAPGVVPRRAVPSPLLFRTLLRGGTLARSAGDPRESWSIATRTDVDREGNPLPPGEPLRDAEPIVGVFPGEVVWTREVRGQPNMSVTIRDFNGENAMKLPLYPVNGKIALKLANLCSHNPLEWNEFELHEVAVEDSDFKWFYQLLEPDPTQAAPGATVRTMLAGLTLPAPHLRTQPLQARGSGSLDCLSAEGSSDFAEESDWSR